MPSRPLVPYLIAGFLLASVAVAPYPPAARAQQPAAPASSVELNTEGDEWIPVAATGVHRPVPALPAATATDASLQIALDRARNAGPQAVLAFIAGHPGGNHPLLEAAAADAREELAARVRSLARESFSAGPCRVAINNGGCVYETIQAAVNAAVNGDTIKVSSGDYYENVDVAGKRIVIVGGYNATLTALRPEQQVGVILTNVTAAGPGSVFDVSAVAELSLRNLGISGGTGFGAGVDMFGNSYVSLYNTDIQNNAGSQGGGLYVSSGCIAEFSNDSDLYSNTATSGGAAAVYGTLYGYDSSSDISGNSSSGDGGGLYVVGGSVTLDNSDVVANTATGRGGGVCLLSGGLLTLKNSSFVGESAPCCNSAADGGGIFADNSQVVSLGGNSTVLQNVAANHGGGLYLANGSTFTAAAGTNVGYDAMPTNGNKAPAGAGIFALGSTVTFSGRIINNVAVSTGGGIHAEASTIQLADCSVGGNGTNLPNLLSSGTSAYGVGLYLADTTHATLANTVIAANGWQAASGLARAGGAYVTGGSDLTLTGCRIENHATPAGSTGRGAALYVENSSVELDDSRITGNTASVNGGAVRLIGSTASLEVLGGSSVTANRALGGEGGAITASSGRVTASASVFQANSAGTDGGAIALYGATLNAQNTAFRDNVALGGDGGAIAAYSSSSVDVLGNFYECDPRERRCSEMSGNSALKSTTTDGYGGAIYLNTGSMGVRHTWLHHNSAERGGAIYQEGVGTVAQLSTSLVFANTTLQAFGAGVRNAGGRMTVRGTTIADNVGGAGYSPGSGVESYVYESIIWGNTSASFGTLTYTLCNIDQGGTAGPAVDPLFVAPGAGENYQLRPGSPAIDACTSGEYIDLYNLTRPRGVRPDRGPFEYDASLTDVAGGGPDVGFALAIAGNPVPFGAPARFVFSLPVASDVTLRVFDVAGRNVATLAAGPAVAGRHEADWGGDGSVAPGIYFAELRAGGRTARTRFAILR